MARWCASRCRSVDQPTWPSGRRSTFSIAPIPRSSTYCRADGMGTLRMDNMMWTAIASLPFVAVAVCVVLAWLILARARREPVHWAFAAALAALAVTEVGNGIDLWSATAEEALRGRRIALVGELLMPLGWLIFSLSFAKSAVASLLREWRSGLWGTGLLTAVFLSIAWSNRFFFVVGGESSADATIA